MKRIFLAVCAAAACATTTNQGPSPRVVSPAPFTSADVHFMAGMIGHHAQAVLIAGWAPSHGASAAVRALCERIVVGQRDEIVLMQRWLGDRHEPVPEADPAHHTMPGMATSMMPGMLTPDQLGQLDSSRGLEFDRLFLKFMIQHHQGAITMVNQLFGSQGGGEEEIVYRFASDVYADQTTEIDRMNRMLEAFHRSPQ
ncbi:MAG: DUF305 domain-containing protein [Gemmatimonadetes bacterium]|nr:MAG: DUF305 domain-containing protein [Gemmatimonadota bacterium]